jgi:hypothetical protein
MDERQQYVDLEDRLEELGAINDGHRAWFADAVRRANGDDSELIELLVELAAGIVTGRDEIRSIRGEIAQRVERLDARG